MDKQQAIDVIRACNLPGQTHEALIEQLLPSARVQVQDEDSGSTQDSGGSHLGGVPSLPPGAAWPSWDSRDCIADRIARAEARFRDNPKLISLQKRADRLRRTMPTGPTPLAFIGQSNVAELAAAVPLDGWPREGSMAFFYEGSAWGFDPLERGHCRVLYCPVGTALVPCDPPTDLPQALRFRARRVSYRAEWTLPTDPPSYESKDDMVAKRQQLRALGEQLASISRKREPVHRCGGHPQQIQGAMRLQCQLVTNGLYCGDSSGYQDPRAQGLRAGAADWQLLLQIDSDDQLGWMWGDTGRLNFWARQQDIVGRQFDAAWMVLQCY
jgi:uncharacterized protein YwqG